MPSTKFPKVQRLFDEMDFQSRYRTDRCCMQYIPLLMQPLTTRLTDQFLDSLGRSRDTVEEILERRRDEALPTSS
jgi:hypothetical protein